MSVSAGRHRILPAETSHYNRSSADIFLGYIGDLLEEPGRRSNARADIDAVK